MQPHKPPPPPPPFPELDSNGKPVGYDTTSYKKYIESFRLRMEERKKDTSKYLISVYDTLISYKDDYQHLNSYLKNQSIKSYHEPLKSLYFLAKESMKIDISEIEHDDNYELRYNSTFPSGLEIWETKFDYKFPGMFKFSRVHFDEQENYGVLFSAFYCGRLCAYGNLILIKKVNGKWHIEKKIDLWVS